jgi:hypothetical protein
LETKRHARLLARRDIDRPRKADAGVLDHFEEGREDIDKAVQAAVVSVTAAEQRFGPVEPCQLPFALVIGMTAAELPAWAEDHATLLVPGALIDGRFEVLMIATGGWQECPWSPTRVGGGEPLCATGSCDWVSAIGSADSR